MSESVFLDKSLSFRRAETHHATPFSVFAVSVYLEKGGSTEKLLELECGGDLHRSENTFKSRVQKLEEKWVHVGMSKNESWHCAIHEWSANWNVVCIAKNACKKREGKTVLCYQSIFCSLQHPSCETPMSFLPLRLGAIASDHAQQVSLLENRLISIQQKLDNITSLLWSQLHE